ncbi:zinc-dependent alcohol dehydrogenase family protein [Halomonas sp. SBBP1]|uniref:zinc-dependent alcohol dehydrogenase family protein n=1 Tax=Halomonas sp. SBBP1 TaxID=2599306 RepID=UPI001CF2333C|nr:NAD(P)-dependent alcohol dehydrogenase [Halomonas sp. SBBP1]MCA8864666.1 NAD(P)-dependent alcohol dehydrogenase [Halomonas sp. SBBP1]
MKRWVLKSGATTLEGLILEDAVKPEPGPGEVRVRIRAVSLNYREQLILGNAGGNWRMDRDLIPVADGAGDIDAIGEGVEQWTPGDKVVTVYLRDFIHWPPHAGIGLGLGSLDENGVLAEYVVLPADRLSPAPSTLNDVEASTLPCAALTAWTALQNAYPVRPGQTVLSLGTGSVSLFAMAFAKALGAKTYLTTSQDDKRSRLLELGAEDVFNYRTDENWGQSVYAATGGVDKVVNTAGFGSMNQSVQALAFGGDIGLVGLFNFGDVIEPGLFLAKGVSVRGIPVGSRDGLEDMVGFIDKHQIKPVIDRVVPFVDVKQAYQAQSAPNLFGKIVIEIA